MPKISLQDIRDAADQKYGPLVIEGVKGGDVELLNPTRLGKEARAAIKSLNSDADGDDGDEGEKLAHLVGLLAKTPAQGKRLLDSVGDDTALLAEIIGQFNESNKLGEASPSPS